MNIQLIPNNELVAELVRRLDSERGWCPPISHALRAQLEPLQTKLNETLAKDKS